MKYKCLCCGYLTLSARAEFDICPVCFWEDDAYLIIDEHNGSIHSAYMENENIPEELLLDIPSGANHGLTLREGKMNYEKYGACEEDMREHVRPPRKYEYPDTGDLS